MEWTAQIFDGTDKAKGGEAFINTYQMPSNPTKKNYGATDAKPKI